MHTASRQLLTGLLSIAALAAAAAAFSGGMRGDATPSAAVLTVEHSAPLAVSVRIGRLPDGRIIELSHQSGFPVRMTLPAGWIRTEARGAPLAAVTSEPLQGGSVRWTVPPRAVVEMRTGAAFEELEVRNPSGVPLSVRLTTVDTGEGTADVDAVIVTDAPVTLPLRPAL